MYDGGSNDKTKVSMRPDTIGHDYTIQPVDDRKLVSVVVDPDNNFQQVVCPECLIADIVGCTQCGLYQFGYNHKKYKFKVTEV